LDSGIEKDVAAKEEGGVEGQSFGMQ